MTTAEAAARLAAMDQVLILTHVRPDGDTIGSAAALCCGLRALGKTAYLLPNPELTATYAPYAAPYLAEADFAPAYVVSVDIAALSLLPENARPYQDRIASTTTPLRSFSPVRRVWRRTAPPAARSCTISSGS